MEITIAIVAGSVGGHCKSCVIAQPASCFSQCRSTSVMPGSQSTGANNAPAGMNCRSGGIPRGVLPPGTRTLQGRLTNQISLHRHKVSVRFGNVAVQRRHRHSAGHDSG